MSNVCVATFHEKDKSGWRSQIVGVYSALEPAIFEAKEFAIKKRVRVQKEDKTPCGWLGVVNKDCYFEVDRWEVQE